MTFPFDNAITRRDRRIRRRVRPQDQHQPDVAQRASSFAVTVGGARRQQSLPQPLTITVGPCRRSTRACCATQRRQQRTSTEFPTSTSVLSRSPTATRSSPAMQRRAADQRRYTTAAFAAPVSRIVDADRCDRHRQPDVTNPLRSACGNSAGWPATARDVRVREVDRGPLPLRAGGRGRAFPRRRLGDIASFDVLPDRDHRPGGTRHRLGSLSVTGRFADGTASSWKVRGGSRTRQRVGNTAEPACSGPALPAHADRVRHQRTSWPLRGDLRFDGDRQGERRAEHRRGDQRARQQRRARPGGRATRAVRRPADRARRDR